MKKKTLIVSSVIGIFLLVGIAFLVKTFGGVGDPKNEDAYDTYTVKTDKPLRVTGKISPETIKTYLNNAQLGTFLNVQVKDGQTVTQGTPLLNYDIDPTQRQKLVKQLNDAQQSGDQQAINQAWRQLNRYDGQVNNSVNATFNGTVSLIDDGQVGEGEPILKLIANELEIQSTISEFDLEKIKVGDTVNVKVTSTGKEGKGKITHISQLPTSYQQDAKGEAAGGAPVAGEGSEGAESLTTNNPIQSHPTGENDKETSKYKITIGELDFEARNGYSVEATIPLDTLKIPKSVLTKDHHVYVVDQSGVAHRTKITYDEKNGELIVKKGVKKGDRIINHPDAKVKDGEKVEVSK
ncbi:efflux RND transporter periplasmic adaptor subunit [Staphylococcus intermedius]|uniref:RND family efflux transporter n=1 Tax=Staphylococcus intermedius NCTC 11048 TaxID=1141106 RepID=A0A380G3P2_STAIN|nr:HlyD family efflux transporter periplasmic adaptor subunit [Staphylococcus intermedius]PCF63929.1 RND transporter [Staphylococcus intermedius]PCF78644.1 RND transporter [Staphylococcus intermedius]PCF79617.1 RND transporter [Staphylococcus intermedius]PCF86647.1 RND transporter [Staphylococcus intermedius]PCF89724.1 RND transporter [Staphylococcus intermedius]